MNRRNTDTSVKNNSNMSEKGIIPFSRNPFFHSNENLFWATSKKTIRGARPLPPVWLAPFSFFPIFSKKNHVLPLTGRSPTVSGEAHRNQPDDVYELDAGVCGDVRVQRAVPVGGPGRHLPDIQRVLPAGRGVRQRHRAGNEEQDAGRHPNGTGRRTDGSGRGGGGCETGDDRVLVNPIRRVDVFSSPFFYFFFKTTRVPFRARATWIIRGGSKPTAFRREKIPFSIQRLDRSDRAIRFFFQNGFGFYSVSSRLLFGSYGRLLTSPDVNSPNPDVWKHLILRVFDGPSSCFGRTDMRSSSGGSREGEAKSPDSFRKSLSRGYNRSGRRNENGSFRIENGRSWDPSSR